MKICIRTCGFFFTVIFLVGLSSCAHKQAYKKALEFEKSGQFLAAAEQDIRALDKKSDFTEAQVHLTQVAPKAYNELLKGTNLLESKSEWMQAITNWQRMEQLLNGFQRHGISLITVDVVQRLSAAKEKGTAYYYQTAGQMMNSRQYAEAISHYQNVLKIDGNYRDTREKIWQAYVRLGDEHLNNQQFADALSNYQSAAQYTTDTRTTNQLIAETYYRWADQMAVANNFREATEKFESVLNIDPHYRDAGNRREEAYKKALRRVAILPFKNSADQDVQSSNILTDNILNSCIKANLKYAMFIDRANLDLLLEEHKLSMSGVIDPEKTAEIGKLEGLHHIVTGTITQLTVQNTPLSGVDQTYQKSYTEKDTAGNDITKTRDVRYREYSSSRTVQIAASFQIVEVETGRYVAGDNFSARIHDEAVWIRFDGNINDLPADKQRLVNKKTEPRSAETLVSEGLENISEKMSKKIIDYFK